MDLVSVFAHGTDALVLDTTVFTALAGQAALTAAQFVSGNAMTTAQDADDRIIYDRTTGMLYYDADGNGNTAQPITFARIGATVHPAIDVGDFVIVS